MKKLYGILAFIFLSFTLLSSARATQVYTSDNSSTGFDATTAGSVPSGWTAITGTWVASTTSPLTGHTHTFANTSGVDGQLAINNGVTATADMDVTYATTVANINSGNIAAMGALARMDNTAANGYACLITNPGGVPSLTMFKRISGSFSGLGSSAAISGGATTGDVLVVRFQTVGTTMRCRAWRATAAEPTAWIVAATDSSTTAAGYSGFYNENAITGTNTVSDFTIGTASLTPSILALAPTTVSGAGGTIAISGTYAGTAPTALNSSIDGGSYTSITSPTIGSGVFSGTITAPTLGYHSVDIQDATTTTTTSTAVNNVTNSNFITVTTPASQTVGNTYAYCGTYGGFTPAALDFRFDSATYGAASSPTISGGNYCFNATAPSAGTHTLSVRDHTTTTIFGVSGSFTTSSGSSIAPNDPSIVYSPYNWNVTGSASTTINGGAYFKTMFTGNSISLNFDVSLMGSPVSQLWYRVDFSQWTQVNVASSIALTIPAVMLSNPDIKYHYVETIIKSTSETINRWNTAATGTAVKFTGLTVDTGATLVAPIKQACNLLIYGDSITEGVRTAGQAAANDTDRNDSQSEWSYEMGRRMGCEVGVVGFGATGFTVSGSGSVPALTTSYNLLYSGQSRTFTPAPTLVLINDGANDGGAGASAVTTAATTVINGLLAATPSTTKILMVAPFPAVTNASVFTGIHDAVTNIASPRLYYVPTTGFFNTAYGSDTLNLHPSGPNAQNLIAPQVSSAISIYMPIGANPFPWTHY